MRIHAIRIHNINSLHGTTADKPHALDFDRDLGGAPLFLIRGPTGAGKSTLLDAITLALFGRTARLGDGSAAAKGLEEVEDTDARRALSHDCSDGYAEIDFSTTRSGRHEHFRARWTVKRARNEGKLQAPLRTLWKLDPQRAEITGILVESSKRKDFEPIFAEALQGMTFDDFVRSVLLAQGDFHRFLKAETAERAALLARLTNASGFEAIGREAARKYAESRDEAARLRAIIGATTFLDDAERQQLETGLAELKIAISLGDAGVAELVGDESRWLELQASIEGSASAQDRLAAATSAEAAFAGQVQALSRHQASLRVLPLIEAVRGRDDELAAQTAEHETLRSQLPHLEQRAAETAIHLAAAQTAVTDARTSQDTMMPAIAAAREAARTKVAADKRLAEARVGVEKAAAALAHTRQHATAIALEIGQLETGVAAARASLDGAGAADLGEKAAILANQHGEIARQDARLTRAKAAAEKDAGVVVAAEAAVVKARAEAEDAVAAATVAAAAENASLASLLQLHKDGAGDGATAAANIQHERAIINACQAASDEVRRSRQRTERRNLRHVAATAAATALTAADNTLAAMDVARNTLTERLAILAEQHVAIVKVVEIVKERGLLREGDPCPLCGGHEHPWRHHPDQAPPAGEHTRLLDEVAAETKSLEKQRATLDADIKTANVHRAKAASDAAHAANDIAESDRDDSASLAALAPALELLRVPTDSWPAANTIDAAANRARGRLEALEAAMKAVQAAEKAHAEHATAARLAALLAETRQQAVKAAIERHAELVRTAEAQALLLEADVTSLRQMATTLAAGLVDAGQPVPDDADMAELKTAITAVRARAEQRTQHEAAVERANTALATAQTNAHEAARAVAASDATLVAAQTTLISATHEAKAASENAETALATIGGQAPDVVEHGLASAVTRTEQALAAARNADTVATNRRAETSQRLVFLETALAATRTALDEARARRDAALAEGAWENADAVLAARLEPIAAQTIEGTARNLVANLTAARESARIAAERLATASAAANGNNAPASSPTNDSATCAERIAMTRIRLEDARAALAAQRTEAGALAERHRTDTELRARHGQQQVELQRLEEAAGRWNSIHQIIGRNDGRAFVELAQAFHLEDLCERANARLKKLSRRYTLTVKRDPSGIPTLDFLIIDAEQADRGRPPSTLSGGETFVVSLALALALADFRAGDMPIETVLIDEGFGTLDPDTLSTVISTLESLHASTGSQIGVISHVAMLAERIPARVFVKPAGQGRSEIVIEA